MRVIFLFKATKKHKRRTHHDGRRDVRICVLVCWIIANASYFSTKLPLNEH
jgi:4-amino-4-deoxy-L-arabinose transferase-like glycosyltransferase